MGAAKGSPAGEARTASARRAIVHHGRLLVDRGYVVGADGNLSVRVGASVYCTPSRVPYQELTPEAVVEVGRDGRQKARNATSELAVHLAIYAARAELAAIVHAHPVWASALAVLREPLPPVLDEVEPVLGGEVSVARYAPAGSPQLAEHAVAGLGARHAVILANHGTVTTGETLGEAFYRLEVLERAAQVYLLARSAGEVRLPG